MLSDHIRWITGHYIKRSCPKNISSLFNITLYDPYILFQMIIPDTALCHLCTFFLYFQTCELFSHSLRFQKDRDDPRSCTHIQRIFSFFYLRKAGKKNRIHPKAEFLRILYHIVSILQIIYTFISPKIMGNSVDIHPALVIMALMVGSALGFAVGGFVGNIVGMLASIPAVAAFKSLFVYYFEKRTGRVIVSPDGVIFKGEPSGTVANPVADATGEFSATHPTSHGSKHGK